MQVRRFCKGMCYQDPGEALEGETVPPSLAKQDDEESDEAPKKQRRRGKNKNDKASGQSVKLSTASGLSDFTPSQGSQDGAAAPPEQLQGIPGDVRDFLRSQGMTSRTPVQERSVKLQNYARASPAFTQTTPKARIICPAYVFLQMGSPTGAGQ